LDLERDFYAEISMTLDSNSIAGFLIGYESDPEKAQMVLMYRNPHDIGLFDIDGNIIYRRNDFPYVPGGTLSVIVENGRYFCLYNKWLLWQPSLGYGQLEAPVNGPKIAIIGMGLDGDSFGNFKAGPLRLTSSLLDPGKGSFAGGDDEGAQNYETTTHSIKVESGYYVLSAQREAPYSPKVYFLLQAADSPFSENMVVGGLYRLEAEMKIVTIGGGSPKPEISYTSPGNQDAHIQGEIAIPGVTGYETMFVYGKAVAVTGDWFDLQYYGDVREFFVRKYDLRKIALP